MRQVFLDSEAVMVEESRPVGPVHRPNKERSDGQTLSPQHYHLKNIKINKLQIYNVLWLVSWG
jgi:hypothetical protein